MIINKKILFLVCLAVASSATLATADVAYDQGVDIAFNNFNGAEQNYVDLSQRYSEPDEQGAYAARKKIYDRPWITEGNVHLYLGIASLASAGVAVATAPTAFDPNLGENLHYKASKAAWQLGLAASLSGLYSHWSDLANAESPFDRDVIHSIIGIVGTAVYLQAVNEMILDYERKQFTTTPRNTGNIGASLLLFSVAISW